MRMLNLKEVRAFKYAAKKEFLAPGAGPAQAASTFWLLLYGTFMNEPARFAVSLVDESRSVVCGNVSGSERTGHTYYVKWRCL